MFKISGAMKWLGGSASIVASTTLVGCSMPNSSNPTLAITNARVSGDSASLTMQLDNPSGMDVTVNSIDWSLVYGPLPVADGEWKLGIPLASGESYSFTKSLRFDSPSLDPSAGVVELSGDMDISTDGNSGNMSLSEAAFVATKKTSR